MQENQLTIKTLFSKDEVKQKFSDLLGKKAQGFMTSVLQIASQNIELAKAEPNSIYQAAATAAILDLPLNSNLGFAYIIPYKQKQNDGSYKIIAQFQMGYKGFIQLAQRSGQFKTMSATHVTEGQVKCANPLLGYEFDFTVKEKPNMIVGYAAYFKLLNGFEKTLYMDIDDLKKHGLKYSKTFGNKGGLWNTDFYVMALKTVIKLLLSKYAPLSVEMQKAVISDQALINDIDNNDVTYVDNKTPVSLPAATNITDKTIERVQAMINDCTSIEKLEEIKDQIPKESMELYEARLSKLSSLTPVNN